MKSKFRVLFIVLLLVTACFCSGILAACSNSNSGNDDDDDGDLPIDPYPALTFTLMNGGESYEVKGKDKNAVSIIIPATYEDKAVTHIADEAFDGYNKLTSVTIGAGITQIGISAFSGCTSLPSITITAGITQIGASAFSGCTSLTSIAITAGITQIGANAFLNCTALTGFDVNSENPNFSSVDGVLFNKAATVLITYPAGKTTASYSTPVSVQTIRRNAFTNSRFTGITLNAGMAEIEAGAFTNCAALTSVVISDTVTTVALGAFSGCNAVSSVTLPYTGNIFGASNNTHFGYIFGAETESQNAAKVPATLHTVTVTKNIGTNAFAGLSGLTSVVISEGVASIGTYAFENCGLTSVSIPSSVNSIGNNAFSGCVNLAEVTVASAAIGNNAFSGCNSIATLTITSDVLSIGAGAFAGLAGLTSLDIPDTVTSIGAGAFSGCADLENIKLPFIGSSAVNTDNAYLGYIFGATSSSSQNTFIPAGISVILTADVIAANAFKGVTALGSVSFPNATEIGVSAFEGCSNLTSVTLPSVLQTIGATAFKGCTRLAAVTVPENVTSIDKGAFENCTGIRNITLPFVGDRPGGGANESTRIFGHIFGATVVGASAADGQNTYLPENLNVTITGSSINSAVAAFKYCANIKTLTLKVSGTIADDTFAYCSRLTSVNLTDSTVSSIGAGAFSACAELNNVTLPSTVTSIASGAFTGTKYITDAANNSIVYVSKWAIYAKGNPSSVAADTVGFAIGAFTGNTLITAVNIPANVSNIGENAFSGCILLESITVDSANNNYSSVNDALFDKNQTQLLAYPTGRTGAYTLPGTVTKIGAGTFSGAAISGITFTGTTLSEIGVSAFENCVNLSTITLPANGLTTIGAKAFAGCTSLTEIEIPKSVTSMGLGVFQGCVNMAQMTMPYPGASSTASQNTLIYLFGGSSVTQDNANLYVPATLKKVTVTGIASGVTILAANAFRYCSKLEEIEILATSVSTMGTYAFANCTSLTKVTFKATIATLATQAFFGCSKLKTIILPATVMTTIGQQAFDGCTELTNIQNINAAGTIINAFPATVTTINANAFRSCTSLTAITLPTNLSATGLNDTAFHGCTGITSITPGTNYVVENGALLNKAKTKLFLHFDKTATSFTVPTTVTSISQGAFATATSLESITLPEIKGTHFGLIFYLTPALSLTSSPTVEVLRDSVPASLKTVTITGNSAIPANAFNGCANITTVNFTGSPTAIGDNAFNGCVLLTSITIPASVKTIGVKIFEGSGIVLEKVDYLLYYGDWLMEVDSSILEAGTPVTELSVKPGTRGIANSAFIGSITEAGTTKYLCAGITKITIPASLQYIGNMAFANNNGGCVALEEIKVEVGNTSFSSVNGVIYSADGKTLVAVPAALKDGSDYVTEFVIPAGVTTVPDYAFAYCINIKKITVPTSATTINTMAFAGCSEVSLLVDSQTVVSGIGSSASDFASSVSKIYIKNTLTKPAYGIYGYTEKDTSDIDGYFMYIVGME